MNEYIFQNTLQPGSHPLFPLSLSPSLPLSSTFSSTSMCCLLIPVIYPVFPAVLSEAINQARLPTFLDIFLRPFHSGLNPSVVLPQEMLPFCFLCSRGGTGFLLVLVCYLKQKPLLLTTCIWGWNHFSHLFSSTDVTITYWLYLPFLCVLVIWQLRFDPGAPISWGLANWQRQWMLSLRAYLALKYKTVNHLKLPPSSDAHMHSS